MLLNGGLIVAAPPRGKNYWLASDPAAVGGNLNWSRLTRMSPGQSVNTPIPPTVLVLDGEQRAALAVVRSLGYRGCRVHVGSSAANSMAGGSRFAASEDLLPDPLQSIEPYCAAVAGLVKQYRAQLVIPVTEPATLALLERPDLVSGGLLPTSDLAHFRRATDKGEVLSLAGQLGLAVPSQSTVTGPQDTLDHISPDWYPLVIKPARSVSGAEGHRRKVGVRYAHSVNQLREMLEDFGPEAGPFLLQQRVEGPGLGVFLLRWGGEIRASFAHRRIREKPPSGGVSVCCESVALPEELLRQSSALLNALDWSGVAMIEYKRDTRSGRNYLMEINPRFWGSLQLAIDAGVDFPWYLVQAALGRPARGAGWQEGLRSRWCLGEVDHLIARVRRSPSALDLPADDPGFLRTVLAIMTPWRPRQKNDVFRWTDPLPALRESIAWLRALST